MTQPIRKDPAGFRTTELANARVLAGLVNDFEELILMSLNRKAGRQLASIIPSHVWTAALFVPLPSDFLELIDNVDKIETFIDKEPATRAAQRVTWAAQAHGIQWASKQLIRAGLEKPDQTITATITAGSLSSPTRPFYLAPEKRMVEMAEQAMVGEIKSLTGYYATGIKRELRASWENGETVSQITKRVREVTGLARNKAVTIARTETLRAGNAAAKERYKSAGVEMVEWVSAYDDRICEECESLHGNTYPMGEAPDLPVHPNCRCTLVPHIERE